MMYNDKVRSDDFNALVLLLRDADYLKQIHEYASAGNTDPDVLMSDIRMELYDKHKEFETYRDLKAYAIGMAANKLGKFKRPNKHIENGIKLNSGTELYIPDLLKAEDVDPDDRIKVQSFTLTVQDWIDYWQKNGIPYTIDMIVKIERYVGRHEFDAHGVAEVVADYGRLTKKPRETKKELAERLKKMLRRFTKIKG